MVKAVITFALPEDKSSDELYLYESSTEDGTYELKELKVYTYGESSAELDLDETKWYKIRLASSYSAWSSPYSDPIFGGDFSVRTSPFLAISTTFDGANYASVSDVYEISGLTQDECSVNTVQKILRSTRAYLDVRLGEINLDSYRMTFSDDVSRRKYNGHLRVSRDIEIYLTISTIMQKLATDAELAMARRADDPDVREYVESDANDGNTNDIKNFSIGDSTLAFDIATTKTRTVEHDETKYTQRLLTRITVFNNQALQYQVKAISLWNSIMPSTIDITYGNSRAPRFARSISIQPLDYSWALSGHIYNSFPV